MRTFEGVLDHGEREGWGLWFDPAVAGEPLWEDNWRGVDSVRVRVSRDAIVLEAQPGSEPASGGSSGDSSEVLPVLASAAPSSVSEEDGDSLERGSIKWFDAEKGYGFISRPTGEDLFVHHSEVEADPASLDRGQEVIYEVSHNDRGPLARNLSLPGSN